MEFEEAKVLLGERIGNNLDFLKTVILSLDLSKTSRILDVGTGRGSMAISLALLGYSVITGEPEGDNWADWKSAAKQVSVQNQIKFQHFKAENLPFPNESFDAIFCFGSFHHIEHKEATLKEFYRVLSNTGRAVIIEFTPAGIEELRKRHAHHPAAVVPLDFLGNLSFQIQTIQTPLVNAYIFKK